MKNNNNEISIKVVKRDGRKVDYDKNKITNAIIKAMSKVNKTDYDIAYELSDQITSSIFYNYKNNDSISIYDIEEIVESFLMNSDEAVAKEYIGYRRSRDVSRKKSSNIVKKLSGLLNNTDKSVTAENANKDSRRLYVQRDLVAGIVTKETTDDLYLIPVNVRNAISDNYLHWHDKDYSPLLDMYNCMLVNLKKMFDNCFCLGNAIIETPQNFRSFCTLATQVVQGVSSSQYGGQTLTRLDQVGAKYVTKSYVKIIKNKLITILSIYYASVNTQNVENYIDKIVNSLDEYSIEAINNAIENDNEFLSPFSTLDSLSMETKNSIIRSVISRSMVDIDKEVYDGCQSIEYQINTIYSTNGQTPFLSISFGLGTSIESRMIQKNILLVRKKGIGKSEGTPVFPKLLFIRCKGVNYYEEDPNYDITELAAEVSALRLYPDCLHYENVCKAAGGEVFYKDEEHRIVDLEKTVDFKEPMGCRSFLHKWVNPKTGEVEYDGRNNMGVISINLVRIALEAKNHSDDIEEREKYFFNKLSEILDVAYEGLTYRAERLVHVKANVSPILYGDSTVGAYGATGFSFHPDEEVGEAFINHRASVSLGFVGLHETVLALYGQKMFKNPEMIEKGKAIMNELYSATKIWTQNSTWSFSVYGTPAENLMNTFIGPDKEKFGIVPGITDKNWYTNSTHLDVLQEATAFEKFDYESNFVKYTPGGVTSMTECNSLKNNPKALIKLWNYAYEHTEISYSSINVKEDRCFACGYVGEHTPTANGYKCPCCGNTDGTKQEVIRRISGYLTLASDRQINQSKKSEIDNRVTHY